MSFVRHVNAKGKGTNWLVIRSLDKDRLKSQ